MPDTPVPAKAFRVTVIVVRALMGLLFLFSSVTYFFDLITPPPNPPGALKLFDDGIRAARYLLPLVKGLEAVCGLCFVAGFRVPFASVLIAPIIVNIFLVAVFLAPIGLPFGIFLVLANAFVAWVHRDRYAPVFRA